jgi:hypothetical protein
MTRQFIRTFVIVPTDEFDEVGRELNTGLFVENGAERTADKVGRDHLLIGVPHNAAQLLIRRALYLCAYLFVIRTCQWVSEAPPPEGRVNGQGSDSAAVSAAL